MPSDETAVATRVPVRGIAVVGGGIIVILALAHFVVTVGQLPGKTLTDLDNESGIGNWYNSMLLFVPGVLVLLHARTRKLAGETWRMIAAFGALWMAYGVEEVAAFHEKLSEHFDNATHDHAQGRGGTPVFGVLILPVLVVLVIAVVRTLAPVARRWFVAGNAIWWSATFGLEQIEAWNVEGHLRRLGAIDTVGRVLTGIQETFEMTGCLIVLVAVLLQLRASNRRFSFQVE